MLCMMTVSYKVRPLKGSYELTDTNLPHLFITNCHLHRMDGCSTDNEVQDISIMDLEFGYKTKNRDVGDGGG